MIAANVGIELTPKAAATHTLPMQSTTAAVAVALADKTQTLPATGATADANLQRAQSARYPPEKRPESK